MFCNEENIICVEVEFVSMQHHFQKRKIFELLTPPQRTRVCVRTEYLLSWCSMLILFNLICNITTLKKVFLTLTPPPGSPGVEGLFVGKIFATMLLHASFPLRCSL